MNYDVICFTERGRETVRRINQALADRNAPLLSAYCKSTEVWDGFRPVSDGGVCEWAGERFRKGRGMLFVSAVGIAVRAISPHVKDKLTDPPVIVMDDNGTFVIPVLSGHVGRANEGAMELAALTGACPVITTSTDINAAFSADVFARDHNLRIINREGIKTVSQKALSGRPVTISVKHYPPEGPVDVIVADQTDLPCGLLLSPKRYTVGAGMKKGTDPEAFERFVLETLSENGIAADDVYALCTIDIKEQEPAIRAFSVKYRIPVLSFDKELLNKAEGSFSSSAFVLQTVGTDNVCERAAAAGADFRGRIIVGKTIRNGMTLAIAER